MRVLLVIAIVAASGCGRRIVDCTELKSEVEARKAPILAEIAALGPDHPWAGEYSTGPDFTGTTLIIAPQSGCLAFDWGCMGVCSMDCGSVSVHDGRVRVSFEKRDHGSCPRTFEEEYVIEGIGALRCLLPVRKGSFAERLCLDKRSR